MTLHRNTSHFFVNPQSLKYPELVQIIRADPVNQKIANDVNDN